MKCESNQDEQRTTPHPYAITPLPYDTMMPYCLRKRETEHNQNDSARDPRTMWTNSKRRRIRRRRYGDFCYCSTTHEPYENVSNNLLEMLSQYRYEMTPNETWKTHLRSKRPRERVESIFEERKGLIGMKKQMRWMQDQEEWYEHENDCNEERKCVLNPRRRELRISRTRSRFPIRSPTYRP